jgi:bifunctional DNA-binding transcriptional regulator/antitoxin component of YhaV-PrlF toxin-antitoxin module
MRFRTTVRLGGKTATGIQVPVEVVESLGQGKRPPVQVTINGHTYRSTVASRGGQFIIPVSAAHREAAGIAAGDEVGVDIELDTEPRQVTVPTDFAEALEREPAAKQYFDSLPYSHQSRHVLAIEEAKTAETRQRRIDNAIRMLLQGRS